MFSTDEFIEASRQFVCIRIETYENEFSEAMVRDVLRGQLENTAFVIFNPQGTRALTRSGRSPGMALIGGPSRTDTSGGQNDEIISQMTEIANRYDPTGDSSNVELQDFHSLRQALNCASADQRLLVVVNASNDERAELTPLLQEAFTDSEIVGKFHLDFVDAQSDREWNRVIHDAQDEPSLMVVRSSQFGLDGQALGQLPLDSELDEIKTMLLEANEQFAEVEERKNYEQHVQAGRRQRIEFDNEVDRDGGGNRRPESGRRRTRRDR